jgi:hypothetical protein
MDLILPPDARVFIQGMLGPTNRSEGGYYCFLTYYLFPRDIGVSIDQPARMTKDGFNGRPPASDAELLSNKYDIVVSFTNDDVCFRQLRNYPPKNPVNPDWFSRRSELVIACLLPLLTALSGICLLRFLFPTLYDRMPMFERLAFGFGLGMMAVAALTLGVKLCGFHGRNLVLTVTGMGAVIESWRNRKIFAAGMADGFRQLLSNPVAVVAVLAFFLIFRLAVLEGIVEFDAVAAWALKAKMIHSSTGSEIVRWFSNPRLVHAHLDYPTLIPSLYAATYDTLGHVNEFAIKFWPTWMLLLMLGALASMNRGKGKVWLHGPSYFLLALLLLPVVQKYVQMEGGTIPMIFFTVLGFLQCAFWQVEKVPERLGLGLTFLFGAAMAKFEGFIFLAMVASWTLLLPSARPSLKSSPGLWRGFAFCLLSALPFICLRARIPALHYESGWVSYAVQHPGITFSSVPDIFMILLSRWFLSSSFANWTADGDHLHWDGKWEGFSSLYNHPTLGLVWVCLLITVAVWFAIPSRRRIILWMMAIIASVLTAFSFVFASFVGITNLNEAIGYTSELTSARYLLPLLLAWTATSMTLLFADLTPSAPVSDPKVMSVTPANQTAFLPK